MDYLPLSDLPREDPNGLTSDLTVLWGAEAQHAMRQASERFNLVRDGAQVGFWYCDLPFDTLIGDSRVKEHFWLSPDAEVTIATFYKRLHPDDRARTRRAIADSIANSGRYDIEYRTVADNDEEKWIRAIGRTLYDAQARPIRFDGVTLDVTARKRAEFLLVEQNQLLEQIASGRSLEDILTELCLAVPKLNPRARACVVFADAQRNTIAGAITPELSPTFGAALQGAPINDFWIGTCGEAMSSGKPALCTDVTQDERGSQMWRDVCLTCGVLAAYSKPILGADGRPLASFLLCFSEPHTPDAWELQLAEFGARVASLAIERQQAEKSLRDANRYAESLISGSPFGLYVVDADFRIAQMNTDAQNGAFINVRPVIGRSFDEAVRILWPQDVAAEVIQIFRHTLETGEPYYSKDFINPRRDTEQIEGYEWQLQRIATPDGRQGVVCYYFDATALREAERRVGESAQAAKRARDYAEATLRTSPVPLLVLDKDFRVNTANDAFYDMFHVNPAETQGRRVYDLGNGQWNIPKLRELLETILPDYTVLRGFEVVHEFEFIGRRTMLLNARRMDNEPDIPARIVLVIEDITERKAIQERLRSFAIELETQVHDRTRDLVQSQERLRAMATEVNLAEQRERKRLAMELHDHLQQTLVLGRIMVGQGRRASTVPATLDVLKKLDDIFSEALTYTRTLVADLSPPVLRDHGLPAGLKWLGEYMKKHQISVTVTVPEKDALQLPDDQAVLLFQSVRELLINSSKHAGTKQADVRLEWKDEQLRIAVSDRGAGFDLAALAVAAGKPDGGISSKFGLLSIQERMRALGGSFELASAPGQGTTATLVLPLRHTIDRRQNPEWSGTARQVRSNHAAPPRHAPIRVLLVDDHPMIRQGLRSIVTAYKHLEVVGEASDGAEAVELAQRLTPDVVVMDINMPKMDGIQATQHIKANQPTIVVIGLSVNQSSDTEQKMKSAGASTYLTKESAVDALCHAIEQAVSYMGNQHQ